MSDLRCVVGWVGAACLASGCGHDPVPTAPSELRLAPADANLFDPIAVHPVPAFDVVAGDMDGDGDVDALVNWHHHGGFELLESRAGRFVSHHDVGIEPDLYAESGTISKRIREQASSGLHLWHDPDRGGRWRFLWRDPEERFPGLAIELESSLGLILHEGLGEDELRNLGGDRVAITLAPGVHERAFSLQTRRIAVRLDLRRPAGDAGSPPLFVGPTLRPVSGDYAVWKGDPHGVAWLDLRGRGTRELFVARGALGGELVAPKAPKQDRLFEVAPDEGFRFRASEGAVPADYGRSRRVEAVDVDRDGRLELWIGSRDTPNRLLYRQPTGRFEDRAQALGLDTRGGAVAAFADADGDGWDDLFYLAEGRIELLRNRSGERFEPQSGEELGLTLPRVQPGAGVIDPAQLRPLDFDRDGDLDLLLLAHGSRHQTRVFRREAERFRDVSAELGIAEARGGAAVAVADLDLDGYPDLVQLGAASSLWHNREGKRFEVLALPRGSAPRGVSAVTTLDANADGAADVLAVGRVRRLLWNRSQHANHALRVTLPDASVGATVVAEYADGSAQLQRFGSAHSTPFSQALQPLTFGVPMGTPIERLRVRWPGSDETRVYEVDDARQIDLAP